MMSKKVSLISGILLQLPGYLLVCSLITATITGFLLAFYYVPKPHGAAMSITNIQEEIFAGSLVVTMHRLSWLFAGVCTLCNMIIIIVSGRFSGTWSRIWYSGVFLVILLFGCSITGFLLRGNESAILTLKQLSTRLFGSTSTAVSLPALFDPVLRLFRGLYIVHGLIIPGALCYFVYTHVAGLRGFTTELKRVPLRPGTILFIFTTVLIALALIIQPLDVWVDTYGEDMSATMPPIMQCIMWLQRTLSPPGTIAVILAGISLLLSVGFIMKRRRQ